MQINKQSSWRYGINIGINNSRGYQYPSSLYPNAENRNKFGETVSLSAIFRVKKIIGFRCNLGIDNIGFEQSFLNGKSYQDKQITEFEILNADALCELRKDIKIISFYCSAGIKMGYILSAKNSHYLNNYLKSSGRFHVIGMPFFGELNAGISVNVSNSFSCALEANYCNQLDPIVSERYSSFQPNPAFFKYNLKFYSATFGIFYKI